MSNERLAALPAASFSTRRNSTELTCDRAAGRQGRREGGAAAARCGRTPQRSMAARRRGARSRGRAPRWRRGEAGTLPRCQCAGTADYLLVGQQADRLVHKEERAVEEEEEALVRLDRAADRRRVRRALERARRPVQRPVGQPGHELGDDFVRRAGEAGRQPAAKLVGELRLRQVEREVERLLGGELEEQELVERRALPDRRLEVHGHVDVVLVRLWERVDADDGRVHHLERVALAVQLEEARVELDLVAAARHGERHVVERDDRLLVDRQVRLRDDLVEEVLRGAQPERAVLVLLVEPGAAPVRAALAARGDGEADLGEHLVLRGERVGQVHLERHLRLALHRRLLHLGERDLKGLGRVDLEPNRRAVDGGRAPREAFG